MNNNLYDFPNDEIETGIETICESCLAASGHTARTPNHSPDAVCDTCGRGPDGLIEYTFREECGGEEVVRCDGDDDAEERLTAWVESGEYGQHEANAKTVWVRAHYIRPDESSESITVTIEPDEPDCTEGEHDWQSPIEIVGGIKENPGCWGHGGGVIIEEVCLHCGCGRTTDTWAQNPETGEQGLDSVEYETGKYAEQIEAMRKTEED